MGSAKAKSGSDPINGLHTHGKACSTNCLSIAKNKSRAESRTRHGRWWVLTASKIEKESYEHTIDISIAAARWNLQSRVVAETAQGANRKIYKLDRLVTEERPFPCG